MFIDKPNGPCQYMMINTNREINEDENTFESSKSVHNFVYKENYLI